MRVTMKGQVTIPKDVREILGITPETDVEFQEENGKFYIVKTSPDKPKKKFARLRGIATANMSTDEILGLTREKNEVGRQGHCAGSP
jgi:antitoxin PrlF